MSYDIYLKDRVGGNVLEFNTPHMMAGGCYQLGGTKEAWLNVTYNYSPLYRDVFEPRYFPEHECASEAEDGKPAGYLYGIRSIYGLSGAESIPVLEAAISKLGDDVSSDYWEATEGNAKSALCQLLAMAQMRPDGIWDGD